MEDTIKKLSEEIKNTSKKVTDKDKMKMFIDKLSNHECFVLFNQLGQSYGKELAKSLENHTYLFSKGLGYDASMNFKIFKALEEVRLEQKQIEEKREQKRKELQHEIYKLSL